MSEGKPSRVVFDDLNGLLTSPPNPLLQRRLELKLTGSRLQIAGSRRANRTVTTRDLEWFVSEACLSHARQ